MRACAYACEREIYYCMKGSEKDILLQANGKQAEEEITKLKGVIERARHGRVIRSYSLSCKKIIKKMQQIFAKTLKIRIFALRKVGNVR